MNWNDPTTLAIVGLVVVAAAWAFWPRSKRLAPRLQAAPAVRRNRGRELIDFAEDIGRDRAGELVETLLGSATATRVIGEFKTAFSTAQQTPPPQDQPPKP